MPEDVSILVDAAEYRAFTTVEIHFAIDSISTVGFTAPFEPERQEFRDTFRPFCFKQLELKIASRSKFYGTLIDVNPESVPNTRSVAVTGYARPGVLADVEMPPSSYPLEWTGLRLHQIAERICEPFGIGVHVQSGTPPTRPAPNPEEAARAERMRSSRARSARSQLSMLRAWRADAVTRECPPNEIAEFDAQIASARARLARATQTQTAAGDPVGPPIDGPPFARVSMNADQKPWAFLTDLAKQRGVILSNTDDGDLLIRKSTTGGRPVARLREGTPPLGPVTPTFSPLSYFSELTGLAKAAPGKTGARHTIKNPRLRQFFRPSAFTVDDTEVGDIPGAVAARMARMFGNMVAYVAELPTWRDPQGELWTPGTTITLHAPSAMIYAETEMLIRDVTLRQNEDLSTTASLGVVLLGAFSGDIPPRLPWDD